MRDESPPGYEALIHRSLLVTLRILEVPFQLVIANLIHALVIMVTFQLWHYAAIALGWHGLFWLITRKDAKQLSILWRYLSYASYYGVPSTMAPSPLFPTRGRYRPFATLARWHRLIDPETGLHSTTNDGLFCTFRLEPYNLSALSHGEQGSLMLRINEAWKQLDETCAVWLHARRRPDVAGPRGLWPDPVSDLIDEEWCAYLNTPGRLWSTAIYLTIWQRPTTTRLTWADWLFFGDRRTPMDRLRESFEARVSLVMDQLTTACHRVTRLDGAALKTYLKPFVSIHEHPVELTSARMPTAYQLADGGLWVSTRPTMGEKHAQAHLRCLSLSEDVPPKTHALLFEELYAQGVAFDWVLRWIPTSRQAAEKFTTNQQLNWDGKPQGWRTMLHQYARKTPTDALTNTHVDQQIRDADKARATVLSGESPLGKMTLVLTTKAPDAETADANIRALQSVLQRHGCIPFLEELNAVEAYLSTFPGEVRANVHDLEVTALVNAHLGPWHLPYQGESYTPHLQGPALTTALTHSCMRYGFSTTVQDSSSYMMIGPFGSGKSVAFSLFDAQWLRYEDATVSKIDIGKAGRCITLCLGGAFYDLSKYEAPMQVMADLDEDHGRAMIYQWLVNRVKESGLAWHPDIGKFLAGGLEDMRRQPRRPRRLIQFLYVLTAHMNKMGGLASAQKNPRSEHLALKAPEVIAALEPFAEGGMFGRLVDAPREPDRRVRIKTFELREFLKQQDAYPATFELLFAREAQEVDGHPIRRDYDEAWHLFANPTLLKLLAEDMPNWRKNNICGGFGAQSLSQIHDTPLTAFLKESCKTRLYLPNAAAMDGDVMPLYTGMSLEPYEIERNIVRAEPKRQMYVVRDASGDDTRECRQLIDLPLQPIALALCASGSQEDQHAMDVILDRHGPDDFPVYWLIHKGFPEEAKRVAKGLLRAHEETRHEPVLALLSAD